MVYPLLRGRDVNRWQAVPSAYILMTQDPETRIGIDEKLMQRQYPKAYAYLKRFEPVLKQRQSKSVRHLMERGAFYSIFAVSDYTFAPWKLVWREQASTFTAAVVGPQESRPIIPDHKLMMVAAESPDVAHYVCAALNSSPATLAVAAYAVEIQLSTHILENVAVPEFSQKNKVHKTLSELSQTAHAAAARGDREEVRKIEAEIDRQAAKLWGLSEEELAEIQRSLAEV